MQWTQAYDPLGHWWLSTLLAAVPIIILFALLAGLKVKPHWCAIAGATSAVTVAIVFFKMPPALAAISFTYGVAFGALKIAWIVLAPLRHFCRDRAVRNHERVGRGNHAGPKVASPAGCFLFWGVHRGSCGIWSAGGYRRCFHDRARF